MRNTQEAVPEPIHVSYNQYIHCPCVQLHVSAKWLSFADYSPPHGLISVPMCPPASCVSSCYVWEQQGVRLCVGLHTMINIISPCNLMKCTTAVAIYSSVDSPFRVDVVHLCVRPTQRFQDGVIASSLTPDNHGHLLYCFHMSPSTV